MKKALIGILLVVAVAFFIGIIYVDVQLFKQLTGQNKTDGETEIISHSIEHEDTNPCSVLNGWWKTGYHEFTITAPIVKSWNGNEGIIEVYEGTDKEYDYVITFESKKDGYTNHLYYYIVKVEGEDYDYLLYDKQQVGVGFPMHKVNDD